MRVHVHVQVVWNMHRTTPQATHDTIAYSKVHDTPRHRVRACAQRRRRPERRPTLRERSTDLTRSNLEDLTQTSSEKVSRHPTAKTETPKAYHPLKPIIHVKQRAQCGGEIPGVDGGETDSGNNTTGECPAGKVAKEKDGEYRGRKSQRHAHATSFSIVATLAYKALTSSSAATY